MGDLQESIHAYTLQILIQEPLIHILQEGEQRGAGIIKGRWAWAPGAGKNGVDE